MRNRRQTPHRGSAGQDARIRLTHVPLATVLGICWPLKMVLRPISTPLHSHLIRHRVHVMLRMHTTVMIMHQLLQLLTEHSLSEGVLGMMTG